MGNWGSRTVIMTAGLCVVLIGVATACMMLTKPGPSDDPIATFSDWAGFIQWIVPAVFVPGLAKMGLDNFLLSKQPPKE